jgi:hypothetical protein
LIRGNLSIAAPLLKNELGISARFVHASAADCAGRTIWIAEARRDDGKRYVVRADEKLAAFVDLTGD